MIPSPPPADGAQALIVEASHAAAVSKPLEQRIRELVFAWAGPVSGESEPLGLPEIQDTFTALLAAADYLAGYRRVVSALCAALEAAQAEQEQQFEAACSAANSYENELYMARLAEKDLEARAERLEQVLRRFGRRVRYPDSAHDEWCWCLRVPHVSTAAHSTRCIESQAALRGAAPPAGA